jgi:hypothetical protein
VSSGFTVVHKGYEQSEVNAYTRELMQWARQQQRRADSAEQMLRAALDQLRHGRESGQSPVPRQGPNPT